MTPHQLILLIDLGEATLDMAEAAVRLCDQRKNHKQWRIARQARDDIEAQLLPLYRQYYAATKDHGEDRIIA